MSLRSLLERRTPAAAATAPTPLKPRLRLLAWVVLLPLALAGLGLWEGERGARHVATYAEARAELPEALRGLKELAAKNPMAVVRFEGGGPSYGAALAVTKVEAAITAVDHNLLVSEVRRGLSLGTVGGAGLALAAGLLGLGVAGLAGREARRSRDHLVGGFSRVRRALPFVLGAQIAGLTLAVLCALLFEGAGLWFVERFSTGSAKLVLAVLALGGAAVYGAAVALGGLRHAFALFTPEPLDAGGRTLGEAEAPGLWRLTRELARSQGALAPDTIVVGLTSGFFVTSSAVRLWPEDRLLEGRTLYLPAPYLGLLSARELAAIIGHELAHFSGEDTAYSLRFAPIYAGIWRALAALRGEGGAALLLAPAATLGFHAMHTFDAAVGHWSRLRELEADRHGSVASGPEGAASALVRTSVAYPVIGRVLDAAFEAPEDAPDDLVAAITASAASEGLGDPGEHLDDRQPHPTDSHPPVRQRIAALGVEIDRTLLDGATRAPGTAEEGLAGALVVDWPGLCRDLSADFLANARRHGAAVHAMLEETAAAMPEGETAVFENGRAMVWTMGIIGGVIAAAAAALAAFAGPLGLGQAPALRWGLPAALALVALGCAAFAWLVHRRGRAPFLVLTPEGLSSPLLRGAVAWTSIGDLGVSLDRRLTLTVALLPEAPLPAPNGRSLRARVNRRKHRFTLTSIGARGLEPQAYANLLGRYLDAARARALLAERGRAPG